MSYRPIRRLGQGVLSSGEVKRVGAEPQGNQQTRSQQWRGVWCARLESLEGDPKPVDLYLGRLKPLERGVEDRTDNDVQIFRMTWE